jgi:hypothetical protein
MKVTVVKATLRFSKEAQGAWKSIEVGAEAEIEPKDKWQDAQAQLYRDLAQQMRTLWGANGNGHEKEHWCSEHGVAFEQQSNGRGNWWSHRTADGWCKEKS